MTLEKALRWSDDEAVLSQGEAVAEMPIKAIAVMGNHELNAILFHRFDSVSDGRYGSMQKRISISTEVS